MSKYDSNKNTTRADVVKEAKEVLVESADVATAVKDLVAGDGSAAEVAKQAGEAVDAAAEALEAGADMVADATKAAVAGAYGWFRTKLGYQLHDGSQGVTIVPGGAGVKAERTEWVETQLKAGLIVEMPAPADKA